VVNEVLYYELFVSFKALGIKLTNRKEGIGIETNNGLEIRIMKIG
jgi:hypothetical protein